MKRSDRGFTLAELLIVIAIIVILVGIAIPSFIGAADKAREATCLANRRSLKAEVIYSVLSGDYEDAVSAFNALYAPYAASSHSLCPSGGDITFVPDADKTGGEIECSVHTGDLGEAGSESSSAPGGGGSSVGGVTLSDASGVTHTLQSAMTWEDIQKKTLPWRISSSKTAVIVSEEGDLWLIYGFYVQFDADAASMSIPEYIAADAPDDMKYGTFLKINGGGYSYIYTEADRDFVRNKWLAAIPKGSAVYWGGKYYAAVNNISEWDSALPDTSGNFCELTGS